MQPSNFACLSSDGCIGVDPPLQAKRSLSPMGWREVRCKAEDRTPGLLERSSERTAGGEPKRRGLLLAGKVLLESAEAVFLNRFV